MRHVFVAFALYACTSARPPPATNPSGQALSAPIHPSEAEIKQRSYHLLRAFDRGDVAAIEPQLARDYLHFEAGRTTSRETELSQLKGRKPGAFFIAQRTWENEQVFAYPAHILFVGKGTEVQGGNDAHGGFRYVGWYTLQWVPDGDAWRLRYWTWQRASAQGQRDEWNEVYRNDAGFTKQPNRLLAEAVRGRRGGSALDLATGQGRNALFLADQGWRVTGVDISDEGLRIARDEAKRRGLGLDAVEADIDTWDFGTNRWDLITMIYAGNRDKWLARIEPALTKGGVLVFEYFAHDPERGQDDGVKPGELAQRFGERFQILRDEIVDDVPDWAKDRAKLQRFIAVKK